jgi:hypothetical protein
LHPTVVVVTVASCSRRVRAQIPDRGGKSAGDFFLSLFQVQTEDEWTWAGVIFNILFTIAVVQLSAVRRRCAVCSVLHSSV